MNVLSAGRGTHWENGVGHFGLGVKGQGMSSEHPPQSLDRAMEPRDLAKLSEVSYTFSPPSPST